ncbi:hypothetical protein [Ruminococcus sp.]|uniref:hypothetical protein n=1 Tax=Ruminococcus sp. TaxID=41978 RepID=UPI0025F7FBB1|nr:hypothetical protein [Ruminococcus sp.]MBQ8965171.1 hypothetical protein [Ruminococcus sp.]
MEITGIKVRKVLEPGRLRGRGWIYIGRAIIGRGLVARKRKPSASADRNITAFYAGLRRGVLNVFSSIKIGYVKKSIVYTIQILATCDIINRISRKRTEDEIF